jgi:hypothetical protein
MAPDADCDQISLTAARVSGRTRGFGRGFGFAPGIFGTKSYQQHKLEFATVRCSSFAA